LPMKGSSASPAAQARFSVPSRAMLSLFSMTRTPHITRLTGATQPAVQHELTVERIGQCLGEWQARELRVARGFRECRGLNTAQLEDIYQEAIFPLLGGRYWNEEHLCNALRDGIKKRALNMHRDERRRREILSENAPDLYLTALAREEQNTPELAALAQQDRSTVLKFFHTLGSDERCVFWLTADGMKYRAIAPELDMDVNKARRVSRSCEYKRERFQLIHKRGRR
jgi:RNA polymerase sigma factor (sigma-70 family)